MPLDWDDRTDFDDATRGFVATLDDPVITDAKGRHGLGLLALRLPRRRVPTDGEPEPVAPGPAVPRSTGCSR